MRFTSNLHANIKLNDQYLACYNFNHTNTQRRARSLSILNLLKNMLTKVLHHMTVRCAFTTHFYTE